MSCLVMVEVSWHKFVNLEFGTKIPRKLLLFLKIKEYPNVPHTYSNKLMMMRRFVERVLDSRQTRCESQSNRCVLRRRANARGQNVAV